MTLGLVCVHRKLCFLRHSRSMLAPQSGGKPQCSAFSFFRILRLFILAKSQSYCGHRECFMPSIKLFDNPRKTSLSLLFRFQCD